MLGSLVSTMSFTVGPMAGSMSAPLSSSSGGGSQIIPPYYSFTFNGQPILFNGSNITFNFTT